MRRYRRVKVQNLNLYYTIPMINSHTKNSLQFQDYLIFLKNTVSESLDHMKFLKCLHYSEKIKVIKTDLMCIHNIIMKSILFTIDTSATIRYSDVLYTAQRKLT